MKKQMKHILVIIVIMLAIISTCTIVKAESVNTTDYSKKYIEWLNLPEKEREGTIPPLPFNVGNVNGNVITRVIRVLEADALPEKYDLREHIDVEVKDQMNTGSCWAFSATSAVETTLAKTKQENYSFSERHMEYATSSSFLDGQTNPWALNRKAGNGGYDTTAFTYYSRGNGPVLEEDMPFENNENNIDINTMPQNSSVKQVEGMRYFPNIYKTIDKTGNIDYQDADYNSYNTYEVNNIRTAIKNHIVNYGAIVTAIYAPNSSELYNTEYSSSNNNYLNFANHAVLIIGWDDNYSKENFNIKPHNDGAYIVLNSWGKNWGDNGIYYISYEDILVEANLMGITQIEDITYDSIYQYDTSEMWKNVKTRFGANVFKGNNDEYLTKVMVGSISEQKCNIYLSEDNKNVDLKDRELLVSNVKLNSGYTTVELDNPIEIKEDKQFAIIVELLDDNYNGIGIEEPEGGFGFGNGTINEGESFISDNGKDWKDLKNEDNIMNLSIKAFTQFEEKVLEVSDVIGRAYANIGGDYSFDVTTSPSENKNSVDVQIVKDDSDLTEQFVISGNVIKGKGTTIKIVCPDNIQEGNYTVNVKLDDFEIISKEFYVENPNDNIKELIFEDENLVKGLVEKLPNGIIVNKLKIFAPEDEINQIKELYLERMDIGNINGIQQFSNIEFLSLNKNIIEDFSPLNDLNKLKNLYLDNTKIDEDDLNDLQVLEQIETLSLCDNDIKDLEFVNKMNKDNIRLYLYNSMEKNEPQNFSELFKTDKFENLDLGGSTWLTEEKLLNLKELSKLKGLSINECDNINDLSFLKDLNIEDLQIDSMYDNSKIRSLEELSTLESLKSISIFGNTKIQSLNGLQNLNNLTDINAPYCSIEDASLIENLPKLEYVHIQNNTFSKKVEDTETLICEVPETIKQVCNENSKIYSSKGVKLENCTWIEYGQTIKMNEKNNSASIHVLSGNAMYTTCFLYVYNDPLIKRSGDIVTIKFEDEQLYRKISPIINCDNRSEKDLTIDIDKNILNSITNIELDYANGIKNITGLAEFTNLERISLKNLYEIRDVDELLKLDNLKEIDVTNCNNINLDNILNKDWKENISLIYEDNFINGYGITEIELPEYYYDIIKQSNIDDVKADILYDVEKEKNNLPGDGYTYLIGDFADKEATTFGIDDENKKVKVKLNNKLTNEHNDIIRAMQFKVNSGKYAGSSYTLFYKIEKVKISKKPNKMKYLDGEIFDPTGMELQILDEDGETYREVKGYKAPKDKGLNASDGMFQTIEIEVEDEPGLVVELNDVEVWEKDFTLQAKIQDKNLYNAIKDNNTQEFMDAIISYNDEEQIVYLNEETAQWINSIDLSNKAIKNLEGLSNLSNLETIDLSGNIELETIEEIEKLPFLKSINLSNTNVSDISCLENNNELEDINISNTRVEDIGNILELPNLKSLTSNTFNLKTENDKSYVTFIEDGSTYNEIINENLFASNNYNINIIDANNKELEDSNPIKTGTRILLRNKDTNETVHEFYTALKGDIDCNGDIDLYDILNLIELVFDTNEDYTWDECIKLAGKCTDNSDSINPDLYDILALIEHVLDNKEW